MSHRNEVPNPKLNALGSGGASASIFGRKATRNYASILVVFMIYGVLRLRLGLGLGLGLGSPSAMVSSSSSFNLAKEQSFGFFDDITDDNWIKLQTILAEMRDHQNPENPLKYIDGSWMGYFAWYQANYEPNFSCAYERRVGTNPNGDGPKWVCDPHRIIRRSEERKAKEPEKPGCIVYSVGSEGDFNFELGMQETVGVDVCEYHIFDMGNYASKMPSELKNAHYHQWGIEKQGVSKSEKQGKRMYGLKDTVKMLGHENLDAIDVFKIDCEGCEFTSFTDWFIPEMPNLLQILVEVHTPPKNIALKFFDDLQANGYTRFHKEANIKYPRGGAIEYAFLKLSKEFFPESKLEINSKLDDTRKAPLSK